MSLRKGIEGATLQTTGSAPDFDRMHQLWRTIQQVGLTGMSTGELEEWSYLMAKSLEGKGDMPVR
jgi:hypothetical protein